MMTGLFLSDDRSLVLAEEQSPTREQLEFFEKQVRPLLAEHCYECHSRQSKSLKAGLAVDSRQGLLTGGDSGPAIELGNHESSLLLESVRYESFEMPPKGKLPEEQIQILERWIAQGAPWPAESETKPAEERPRFDLEARRKEQWAWQPIQNPPLPEVQHSDWPRQPLDHFILARLEAARLAPAVDADRLVLLRRLSLDLTGLPPGQEQMEAYLADDSAEALERVVDELLASPHYGERWGRHWLDLVRYAESRGHQFDNDTPNAWQYRDYIIRALNADVSYDQLVREHLAGDLLPQPRLNPETGFNESILGSGFWYLGDWLRAPVDIRKDETDRFDNMIDVMSKTFLGVTVSCARCHDHKYDPISMADYYALSGFLQSSDYRQVPFESLEQNRKVAAQLAELEEQYRVRLQDLLSQAGLQPPEVSEASSDHEAVVVDYGRLPLEDYLQDGVIFGQQPVRAGQFCWNQKGELEVAGEAAARNDPFWHGIRSITLGEVRNQSRLDKLPSSGRTLKTPSFELKSGNLACLVKGRGDVFACVDSYRLIFGPLHGETLVTVKAATSWTRLKLDRYVGHQIHLEFVPAEDSQLSVELVVQGLKTEELNSLEQQRQQRSASLQQYSTRVEGLLQGSVPPGVDPQTVESIRNLVRAWKEERESLREQIVLTSHVAPAMMEGTGEDDHVLIRGNSSNPGPIEKRHFLTAIKTAQPMEISTGSGRLQLAEAILDPANPLTSRVMANRIWHHLLGRGIVPTVDDFGFLGERPTHPELLDHLAIRFQEQGFSIKKMIREIVLSRSYQMASMADPQAKEQDPKNLLWHHRPMKRLQGEAIRDSLLTLSGRLDRTQFGPPVPIHLTDFMDGRGRPAKSGPLDGAGRRSIYISVRRNFLSPFMQAFDTPVPFSTMGRRNVSNVPAQALILMNDPFVQEQAKGWATRALDLNEDPAERIRWLYRSALVRDPTEQELAVALEFVEESSPERWADLAHILINTKEFIFLR
ncbi:MAG: PSD1 domain-containing protein [Planctomycetaceae bacterium]|nr:PSD1 domain-containing protein [Planctomycetaceae bacterium]